MSQHSPGGSALCLRFYKQGANFIDSHSFRLGEVTGDSEALVEAWLGTPQDASPRTTTTPPYWQVLGIGLLGLAVFNAGTWAEKLGIPTGAAVVITLLTVAIPALYFYGQKTQRLRAEARAKRSVTVRLAGEVRRGTERLGTPVANSEDTYVLTSKLHSVTERLSELAPGGDTLLHLTNITPEEAVKLIQGVERYLFCAEFDLEDD